MQERGIARNSTNWKVRIEENRNICEHRSKLSSPQDEKKTCLEKLDFAIALRFSKRKSRSRAQT